MKKIMIIGATWEQLPLLEQAKKMGLYVIATDPNPDAEGFQYADAKYIVNPRDLIQLDQIFFKEKPDAIISDECDYSIFAVAYLTQKYNLPGPKIDSSLITGNKYLQRKCAQKDRIPQPEFKLCFSYHDTEEAVDQLGLPVVIKPIDNRGSIGISKIENIKNLKIGFFNAIANSYSRELIVEKFIEGLVVTVEGIYTDKFYNLTFSTKVMHPDYQFNAMQLAYPGNLAEKVKERLYAFTSRIVAETGINFGLTHTEFIVNDEEIYFIEIANRGGGVNISNKIVPSVTGIDVSDLLIKSAFGERIPLDRFFPLPEMRCCILHFFDFGSGKLKKIANIDTIRSIKGILGIRINIKKGDLLGDIETAVHRPGFIIVTGKDNSGCLDLIREVEHKLKVKVE